MNSAIKHRLLNICKVNAMGSGGALVGGYLQSSRRYGSLGMRRFPIGRGMDDMDDMEGMGRRRRRRSAPKRRRRTTGRKTRRSGGGGTWKRYAAAALREASRKYRARH
jgi:hypothetical protein